MPATTTAPRRPNLCSLLDWPDLGYPGTEGGGGPTKTGVVPGATMSCEWTSQQFNAGYTPPPIPSCTAAPGDIAGNLTCADGDVQRLTAIENNSSFVIITAAYKAGGRPLPQSDSYVDHGHTVYLVPDTNRCTGATRWAGGAAEVTDGDATKAFGPTCDEVKKLVALLVQREPHRT